MSLRHTLSCLTAALAIAGFSVPAVAQTSALSTPAYLTEKAPDTYKVKFDTSITKAPFEVSNFTL